MPDKDHPVDALLVMAQQGTHGHQSFGPFATASKKEMMTLEKLSPETMDWPLIPLPLNILRKKPSQTITQRQAATSFNNIFVDEFVPTAAGSRASELPVVVGSNQDQ
jgi:hypothetical protein